MTRLDVHTLPLHGAQLIEASAGTGKTYTIAALYVRLVLGHGSEASRFVRPLTPQDILVMTFTRAATRELRDRIRARLAQAAAAFRQGHVDDAFLTDLLVDHPDEARRRAAAYRLAMAADSMDSAAIFTIDAWCQRMLREHAFDSGSLFEETLVPDERELIHHAALDTWRQLCYPLPVPEVAAVLGVWPSPEAFEADMAAWMGRTHLPHCTDTPAAVVQRTAQARLAALQVLRQVWLGRLPAMRAFVASQDPPKAHGWNGTKFKLASLLAGLDAVWQWAQASDDSLPALALDAPIWTRLTPQGLLDARAKGHEALPALPLGFDALDELQAGLVALPDLAEALRPCVAWHTWQRLQHLKAESASLGFGDMLRRLHDALHGAHGAALQARMVQQYPVALIDEFQDTSPMQYQVFAQVYTPEQPQPDRGLFLIGDPKQSIYGFRGADIHSYLAARLATQGHHHALDTNHRSSAALVAAVDGLFHQAQTRWPDGALNMANLPYETVQAKGQPEQWSRGGQALPCFEVLVGLTPSSKEDLYDRYAAHCAEQVVRWLNDSEVGCARAGALRRVQPQDMAVLVRTSHEAQTVQKALQARGVTAVFLSDKASVWATPEAHDMGLWLQGVAHPSDLGAVRSALATSVMGLPLADMPYELQDDTRLDQHLAQFVQLHQVWKRQGVMAMLRQSVHRMGWAPRWLAQAGGERRLTNWLHLAELLQNAAADLDGERALIRWLQQRLSDPHAAHDGTVLRLESDADLVKIVTIHASKGLEYPVVLMPFASVTRHAKPRRVTHPLVSLSGDDGVPQLHWAPDEAVWAQADRARLCEDIRLFYVALTRAKHALWLGCGALKEGGALSAVAYLLGGGAALSPQGLLDAWHAVLPRMGAGAAVCIDDAAPTCTLLQRPSAQTPLRPSVPYQGDFERHWTLASYSRLTRDLGERPAPLPPQRAPESWGTEPGLAAPPVLGAAVPIWHRFARGPFAGTFLHDQLEQLAHDGFDPTPDSEAMQRLQNRLQKSAYAADAPALQDWLAQLMQTPLCDATGQGPRVCLAELANGQAEPEFWLPMAQLHTAQVDALSHAHWHPEVPRPALQNSRLQGMLMGFMDWVFEHQGRYWVLDYKSNHLGPSAAHYTPAALTDAMAQHRYDVQAVLYTVALERLLRWRLGAAYRRQDHLGGALYWFIRGWDAPSHGVHVVPAQAAWLDGMHTMFAPAEVLP